MLEEGEYSDFGDMVLWLRDDFIKDGYDISYTYEENASLPVDLFCTKGKGKTQQCCVVLVASINNISDEFQKKLLFYQYYLSIHYNPSQYRIILAIPASTTVVTTPYYAEKEEEKGLDYYKEKGFGLWKIRNKDDIDKETYCAMTLRDTIAKDFKNIIAKDKKGLKRISSKIPTFVDKYIHDSLYGVAFLNPVKFKERFIDVKLLYNILKLERISYRNYLFNAINEHLSYKDDEYDFVEKVFSDLWKEWIGIPYSDFLKTFDPALQHIFAEKNDEDKEEDEDDKVVYRDHYIHQFQVFLSGLYIIDKYYDVFTEQYNKPEIIWLITSSFHDMAYPVQLYDKWSDDFFKKVFHIAEFGNVELKTKFVEESFLSCMSGIITRLCSKLLQEDVSGDWYTKKYSLVQCFYKEITELKNHCILSSISLLKIIQGRYINEITIDGMTSEDALQNVFIPSALAIALHDYKVWGKLKDDGEWKEDKCPLPVLDFNVDPLSFLLIFCDNIQEWGRPSWSNIEGKEERRKSFYLKDFTYDPTSGFFVTICTPNLRRTDKVFTKKEGELREVQAFLKQPQQLKFTIRLEDENNKGEDFEMQGYSS